MNKNFPEFRSNLQKAMQDYATQADFAKEAGIAPATLNRMINQTEINRPNRTTLRKIANASHSHVSYNEMLSACGYDPETAAVAVVQKDVDKQFSDFCAFLATQENAKYPSINEFIENAVMLGSSCDISYTVSDTIDVNDNSLRSGDYVNLVTFSCNINNAVSAATDFAVFYYRTDKDSCIITFATNDANITAQYGSTIAKEILELRQKANATSAANTTQYKTSNVLYYKRKLNRKFEPVSTEDRLLHAIFGDTGATLIEKTVHITGIGFYIPTKTPDFVLKKFLMNHKDTFCVSDKEKRIYNEIVNNGVSKNTIRNYNIEANTGAGRDSWLGIIVNVILRETGINTQGWLGALHDKTDELPVADAIVFANSMPWEYNETEKSLTRRDLIRTLDSYAREFRTMISDCSFDATYIKSERHK